MQGGGRVVRRVFAGERVADALAETEIFVGAPDPVVHRVGQKFAFYMHVLPDFRQYDGIAGILTDGHFFLFGDFCVFQYGFQSKARARLRLRLRRPLQRRLAGGDQAQASLRGKFVYCIFDCFGCYGSHVLLL